MYFRNYRRNDLDKLNNLFDTSKYHISTFGDSDMEYFHDNAKISG